MVGLSQAVDDSLHIYKTRMLASKAKDQSILVCAHVHKFIMVVYSIK